MKNRSLTILNILLIIYLGGCRNIEPEATAPDDLIEREVFTEILADQLIIESTIFQAPPNYNKKIMAEKLYGKWMEKYGITPERFQHSTDYYFYSEENAKDIMTEAKAKILKRKQASCP